MTGTYDTSRLATLGARFKRTRSAQDAARDELLPEVEAACRARVPQAEIVKLTGLTRERVRQIERGLGLTSRKEPAMTTLASLASEYKMQPHELRAYADLSYDTVVDDQPALDAETETLVRDLIDKSDADGVYRG